MFQWEDNTFQRVYSRIISVDVGQTESKHCTLVTYTATASYNWNDPFKLQIHFPPFDRCNGAAMTLRLVLESSEGLKLHGERRQFRSAGH